MGLIIILGLKVWSSGVSGFRLEVYRLAKPEDPKYNVALDIG